MSFQSNHWLIAIPFVLLALTLLFAWTHARRHKALQRVASPKLLSALLENVSQPKERIKHMLLMCGIACLMLALARPQWGYRLETVKSQGLDLLIALDTSKSMLAQDVRPNRFERSKMAILDLLQTLKGDRIGLITFAGDAFLQCPLTLDYDAFMLSLKNTQVGSIAKGGTHIAAAIKTAENAYSEAQAKILILITDGEDLSKNGIEAARQAAQNGLVIYTIGIGNSRGELIPLEDNSFQRDSKGQFVKTALDESTLQAIAQATHGLYANLAANSQGMDTILQAILKQFPRSVRKMHQEKIAIERFQWPLALGMLFLAFECLLSKRRSSKRL